MNGPQRREFLQAAAAAGSGLLILKPETVFGSQANSAVEVGIIGCGGRGNYIADFFVEHTGARIVAVADAFKDRAATSGDRLKVDAGRRFAGLAAHKELLAGKLDAVAIESPPYFHPEHAAAAIDAGKHVYTAKPIAVDVAGCQTIAAAGRKAAAKHLSLLVDFQTRIQPVFVECASRVHRGDIGPLVMGHVYYHAGRLRPQARPGMSAGEARLRNWVFDKVLSGDIIVEQNIHVIDVANWYAQAHPVMAVGTGGGRKARVDVGDCWDHFMATFTYPDGVKVDFSSAQFTRGYDDLCIRFYGAKGTVDSHYNGMVRITGDNPWMGAEKDPTFRDGAIANVKRFVEALRAGQPVNNVEVSVESNLTAILGRMAAYRGGAVTWDEMMASDGKMEARLEL
jgi:myo-inositol 2-dehydrogenase / D-chiro-inositol 1-dehydrogenase